MANIFKVTAKRRMDEAEKETPVEQKTESTESQPSGTMSQSDFLYGTEGMRRKPKGRPPASMNP